MQQKEDSKADFTLLIHAQGRYDSITFHMCGGLRAGAEVDREGMRYTHHVYVGLAVAKRKVAGEPRAVLAYKTIFSAPARPMNNERRPRDSPIQPSPVASPRPRTMDCIGLEAGKKNRMIFGERATSGMKTVESFGVRILHHHLIISSEAMAADLARNLKQISC